MHLTSIFTLTFAALLISVTAASTLERSTMPVPRGVGYDLDGGSNPHKRYWQGDRDRRANGQRSFTQVRRSEIVIQRHGRRNWDSSSEDEDPSPSSGRTRAGTPIDSVEPYQYPRYQHLSSTRNATTVHRQRPPPPLFSDSSSTSRSHSGTFPVSTPRT
ncbi:hypothetical protein AMATHDRAFT_68194 [Amanita thiersii Skay4041]|uniref:Uncharacterized protein n=1 Tax=Amanita thiersii Skay4041 TaxID=703135 RepID=A0A2A9N8S6_9AGAR|nr:hypothetical protein AMATHDRAFT_68194 [Amanita thiersii Skay4041]